MAQATSGHELLLWLSIVAGCGFGAWMGSFGAGAFAACVYLAAIGVADDLVTAIKGWK